jgi:hypothetical protein
MRTGRRTVVAGLIALCGIAIAFGATQTWVGIRGHRPSSGIEHTAIAGVLHWHYQLTSSFTNSFAMVILVAGALVFVGGVFASGLLAGLFSLIALAAAGVWIGLNAAHFSPISLTYTDLRLGAWLAIGGSLIGLLSSFFVRRRQM